MDQRFWSVAVTDFSGPIAETDGNRFGHIKEREFGIGDDAADAVEGGLTLPFRSLRHDHAQAAPVIPARNIFGPDQAGDDAAHLAQQVVAGRISVIGVDRGKRGNFEIAEGQVLAARLGISDLMSQMRGCPDQC